MAHKHCVLGFAFDSTRHFVVLMKKNRPAWQAGRLNGPGGKIEDGEDIFAAMSREFREETGVETQSDKWHHFATLKSTEFNVAVLSYIDDAVLSAKTTTDEEVVIVPIDLKILATQGIANLGWLIGAALDDTEFFIEANYDTYDKPARKAA